MRLSDEKALIEQFAPLLNLHNFKITISKGELQDEICRANCDFIHQTIHIIKGSEYYKMTPEQQRNTIIHELVESRILWMEQKIQDKTHSIIYQEREDLVNEITKVFERIK